MLDFGLKTSTPSFSYFLAMIKTLKHLAYTLKFKVKDFESIITNTESYYTCKIVNKKKFGGFQIENGEYRQRTIYPSHHRLKNLQRRISILLQSIDLPIFAYGSVKGRNNISNALQHTNNSYFFTVDLKDFFSNINRYQIYQMFVEAGFSPTVARVLTQLTTYHGKLPQGPPSSPIVSNLVFIKTGTYLQEFSRNHGITFTSFLDDLTFSSNQCFKHLTSTILDIIKSGGFYPHPKKIKYKIKYSEVTGILICDKKMMLPKKILEKARTNPSLIGYIKYFKGQTEQS